MIEFALGLITGYLIACYRTHRKTGASLRAVILRGGGNGEE